MGVCERSTEASSTLYNTQLFITPNGVLAAKHQKLVPTHAERVVHAPVCGAMHWRVSITLGGDSGA